MDDLRSAGRRFADWASRPDRVLMLVYALGLIATRWIGTGGAGQPLIDFSAPLAAAILIRRGRIPSPGDALRMAVVHAPLAFAFGDGLHVAAVGYAANLASVVCASAAFLQLRRDGLIASQVSLALAATAAAACGGFAHAAFSVAAMPPDQATLAVLATFWASATFGGPLVLGVILTANRDEGLTVVAELDPEDSGPASWERHVASGLVAMLILTTIAGGRVESALAASVAMLWFALRLGVCATWITALSFATALLAFAADGRWAGYVARPDPVEAALYGYLGLALLIAPSILVATAVHDQKRVRRMFAYRATHDGLTKLVNRSRFLEVLDAATAAAHSTGKRFALLLIDLDFFKAVNDSFGHQRGDALLVEVADRLRSSVRGSDVVARIGGDEFAVVAPLSSVEDGMKLAKRLVENMRPAFEIDGATLRPTITLGGVLSPDCAGDPQRLFLLADEALYAAKAAGRNCWRFSSAAGESGTIPLWRPAGEGQPVFETVFLD